jgi:hypothetical protein
LSPDETLRLDFAQIKIQVIRFEVFESFDELIGQNVGLIECNCRDTIVLVDLDKACDTETISDQAQDTTGNPERNDLSQIRPEPGEQVVSQLSQQDQQFLGMEAALVTFSNADLVCCCAH